MPPIQNRRLSYEGAVYEEDIRRITDSVLMLLGADEVQKADFRTRSAIIAAALATVAQMVDGTNTIRPWGITNALCNIIDSWRRK